MWMTCWGGISQLSVVSRQSSVVRGARDLMPMGARMARADFEKLEVYRLSEKLADAVWKVVKAWGIFARDTVGKQLVRAVDSVGANIAEGVGRGTYQDNKRFVRIGRGSLYEVIHWLRRAYVREL